MSRDLDWQSILRAAAADLRQDEELETIFTALAPLPSSMGMAPDGVWLLILAANHVRWRRSTRAAAEASNFPLAPRMFIGLTSQRLLIWEAPRKWRLGTLLGWVPRERITGAVAPTVGAGWRTVLISLADAPDVAIKAPPGNADRLASVLSGQPTQPAAKELP
jgi:hypothetical protein